MERIIRVGLICLHDPSDASARSGVTFSTYRALAQPGIEVSPLSAQVEGTARRPTGRRFLNRIKRVATMPRRGVGRLFPFLDYSQTLRTAAQRTARVQEKLDRGGFHALVCVNASSAVYGLRTRLPMIYSTDATAALLTETYDDWKHRPEGFRRAWHEIEKRAIQLTRYAALASERTIESAVTDYGLPRERAVLVPRGANIVPENPSDISPRRLEEPVHLTVVGKDPIRKRVGFCIEVARCLEESGLRARLNYIGRAFAPARRSAIVRCHGTLNLSDSSDRALHREILGSTHFFLLPSKGEAYGIAAVEAAHFGCPCLVSDVGGLSTIVRDGETGFVFPLDAPPKAYADRIRAVWDDPGEYRSIALAALDRARHELNWEAWGHSVIALVRRALSDPRIPAASSSESRDAVSH